jgi:hypothetical protein
MSHQVGAKRTVKGLLDDIDFSRLKSRLILKSNIGTSTEIEIEIDMDLALLFAITPVPVPVHGVASEILFEIDCMSRAAACASSS